MQKEKQELEQQQLQMQQMMFENGGFSGGFNAFMGGNGMGGMFGHEFGGQGGMEDMFAAMMMMGGGGGNAFMDPGSAMAMMGGGGGFGAGMEGGFGDNSGPMMGGGNMMDMQALAFQNGGAGLSMAQQAMMMGGGGMGGHLQQQQHGTWDAGLGFPPLLPPPPAQVPGPRPPPGPPPKAGYGAASGAGAPPADPYPVFNADPDIGSEDPGGHHGGWGQNAVGFEDFVEEEEDEQSAAAARSAAAAAAFATAASNLQIQKQQQRMAGSSLSSREDEMPSLHASQDAAMHMPSLVAPMAGRNAMESAGGWSEESPSKRQRHQQPATSHQR